MTANNTREFFHKKKQKAKGAVDWQAKKLRWMEAIEKLYDDITLKYLAAAIDAGDVNVSRVKKTIVEQFIGQYEVSELVLEVGNERVVFSPKGCNIVGAAGRIDVIGEQGEQTIVAQPRGRWSIIKSRTPALRITPLDEAAFLETLKDVMRP